MRLPWRLHILKELLYSPNRRIEKVSVQAFESVLKFSPFYFGQDGASIYCIEAPRHSWFPAESNSEIIDDYWKPAFFMLAEYIMARKAYSEKALQLLGNNLYPVILTPLVLQDDVRAILVNLMKHAQGSWTSAFNAITHLLRQREPLKEERIDALNGLLEKWAECAGSLYSRIPSIVSCPSESYMEQAQLNAYKLGEEIIERHIQRGETLPLPILSQLLQGSQCCTRRFGIAFGELCNHEQLKGIFEDALVAWQTISDDRKPDFLLGVLMGMGDDHPLRNEFISQVSSSSALVDLLVPFTQTVNVVKPDEFAMVSEKIKEGSIESSCLETYEYFLWNTSSAPEADFIRQLQSLWEERKEITSDLIDLFHPYLEYHDGKYQEPVRAFLRKILCSATNFSQNWAYLAKREFRAIHEENEPREWILPFFQFVCKVLSAKDCPYDSKDAVRVLLDYAVPVYAHEVLCFVADLLRNIEHTWYIRQVFHDLLDNDGVFSWIHRLPETEFKDWVLQNSDLALTMLPLVPKWKKTKDGLQWCPHVKWLVSAAPGNEDEIATSLSQGWGEGCYMGHGRNLHYEDCKAAAEILAKDADPRMRYIGERLLIDVELEVEISNDIFKNPETPEDTAIRKYRGYDLKCKEKVEPES